MQHTRMAAAVAATTIFGLVGCARPAQVETASGPVTTTSGGEVTTAVTTPLNQDMLPAGAAMQVTLNQQLGTGSSHVGDQFTATVTNAVIAQNGSTVVPSGATVYGHVTGVSPSRNVGQQAAIVLDFDSLSFNGHSYPFAANVTATNLQQRSSTSTNQTLKNAAIGAAAGAVLGAVLSNADRDKILLGAGLGAVAGTAISLGTSDVNAVLPAGSQMTLQATQNVAIR